MCVCAEGLKLIQNTKNLRIFIIFFLALYCVLVSSHPCCLCNVHTRTLRCLLLHSPYVCACVCMPLHALACDVSACACVRNFMILIIGHA